VCGPRGGASWAEGWPKRPVDVDCLGSSWSRRRLVILVRPLVRRLVGEVACSRRVARSQQLPYPDVVERCGYSCRARRLWRRQEVTVTGGGHAASAPQQAGPGGGNSNLQVGHYKILFHNEIKSPKNELTAGKIASLGEKFLEILWRKKV
jgi:hypothetical protein